MKRLLVSSLIIASLGLYIAKANPPPVVLTPGQPDLSTAHGLFQACTDVKNAYFPGYCLGFINGVADMMRRSAALSAKRGVRLNTDYCPPASITREDLSQAFMIWHDQYAEHRDRYGPAADGVVAALQDRWPCAGSQE